MTGEVGNPANNPSNYSDGEEKEKGSEEKEASIAFSTAPPHGGAAFLSLLFCNVDIVEAVLYYISMKISIKATGFDLTPSITTYIEEKLGSLAKFLQKFDLTGQPELWVEIGRTTRHHAHGDVFRAEADLRLPKKILRGVEEREDIHAAIDGLKNTLRLEIEKYKTKAESHGPRVGKNS